MRLGVIIVVAILVALLLWFVVIPWLRGGGDADGALAALEPVLAVLRR